MAKYTLMKTEGRAKRAQFETVHGTIQTPVFMNVGTSTVKRLSSNTLALTTLIKVWHDYIHAAGLSSNSCNYTLQILIMIIRRH